jgi:uncharacterized protein
VTSILWRRLDVPGHDACRLTETGDGWTLDGTAVFSEGGAVSRLAYSIECDRSWRTRQGQIHGWIGERTIALRVMRTTGGAWRLNDQPASLPEGCADLDLGFSPASNLTQIRRVALAVGQAADVPVAWLDAAAGTLEVLLQRYERRTEATYWYEAPRFEYAALLEVAPAGFVRRYPGLWEAEPDAERK